MGERVSAPWIWSVTGLNVDIPDSVLVPCHYMFRTGSFMGGNRVTTCDRVWPVLTPSGHLWAPFEGRP